MPVRQLFSGVSRIAHQKKIQKLAKFYETLGPQEDIHKFILPPELLPKVPAKIRTYNFETKNGSLKLPVSWGSSPQVQILGHPSILRCYLDSPFQWCLEWPLEKN